MTNLVSRHCEPAKQSRCTSCFWIASQARNDGYTLMYARTRHFRLFDAFIGVY